MTGAFGVRKEHEIMSVPVNIYNCEMESGKVFHEMLINITTTITFTWQNLEGTNILGVILRTWNAEPSAPDVYIVKKVLQQKETKLSVNG